MVSKRGDSGGSKSGHAEKRSAQKITAHSLISIKVPHSVEVNPAGDRVVFAVNEADFEESRRVDHLWLADIEAGASRQITFSPEGEHSPRWSPDGRNIAFLSTRPGNHRDEEADGDESDSKEQLWVLPLDAGEARRVTHESEGVRCFHWIPDGSGLMILSPQPRPAPVENLRKENRRERKIDPVAENEDKLRMQLQIVPLDGGQPTHIYTGDYGVAYFVPSPDGKRVAFLTNYTGEGSDYHRFDLWLLITETGETRKLVERPGSKFLPCWSPNGQWIAFISISDSHCNFSTDNAYMVSVETDEFRNVCCALDNDVLHMSWSRHDGNIYILIAAGVNTNVIQIEPQLGSAVRRAPEGFDTTDLAVGLDGLALVRETGAEPPELVWLNLKTGDVKPLSSLNSNFLHTYAPPRHELIKWQSDNGLTIEGIITYPRNYREGNRCPLVVQVHGGPKGRSTNSLRSYCMHPLWADEGYLVLRPNYRGSEGYGNDFATANARDLGGGDFRDVMAGIDSLIDRGLADSDRIAIMGGSYGGYMTNWAISQSDRFKVAVSMFGIFNLITDFSNSEYWRWDTDYLERFYWEDPDIYRRLSPATYADRIQTPVLIIHGESDNNTFISNSKEMYQSLHARGVPCRFIHYPREGHGLQEPNHRLDEMNQALAWVDRYLKNANDGSMQRIGDRIIGRIDETSAEAELIVTSAELSEIKWKPESSALLKVEFTLIEEKQTGSDIELPLHLIAGLRRTDGQRNGGEWLKPVGVPVRVLDTIMPVLSNHFKLKAFADDGGGRIVVAVGLLFSVPNRAADYEFRFGEFPPVQFAVEPGDKKGRGADKS